MTSAWDDAFERSSKIEARREFVALKTCFMQAASDVAGAIGQRLLREVRRSTQAEELWRIRAPILCSLPVGDERSEGHRQRLTRDVDHVFALLPLLRKDWQRAKDPRVARTDAR